MSAINVRLFENCVRKFRGEAGLYDSVIFDAETRAFLERPHEWLPIGHVLRIAVLAAAVVALVAIAWQLIASLIGG